MFSPCRLFLRQCGFLLGSPRLLRLSGGPLLRFALRR